MSNKGPRQLFSEIGDETVSIARIIEASPDHVARVLAAKEDDNDGRSRWMWVRLDNGDLLLGVFPHGNTYFQCDTDPNII